MPPVSIPRTSVVMPARDAAQTIGISLRSLLAQTDPSWEAIVVDDGSTDDTVRIVREHAMRDRRIALIPGPVAGVSAARNAGLRRAVGLRVVFLDSDDEIDPRFLEMMNGALASVPSATAAYCDYARVTPDGRAWPADTHPEVTQDPVLSFSKSCPAAIHAVLVDRDILLRVNGFDPSLKTCEDWDLWQRVAHAGGDWVHVPHVLSFYHSRSGSLSRDVGQFLADGCTVIARGCALAFADAATAGRTDAEARALAYFVLWCGAQDCAKGGSGEAALQRLRGTTSLLDARDHAGDVLVDAIAVGQQLTPAELANHWPRYGDRVSAFIAAVDEMWSGVPGSRQLQYEFERRVLEHSGMEQQHTLKYTAGVRIDLSRPQNTSVPSGADRLFAFLCFKSVVRSTAHVGVLGAITSRDWLEIAVERTGPRALMLRAGGALMRSVSAGALARAVTSTSRSAARQMRYRNWRHLRYSSLTKTALRLALRSDDLPGTHQHALAALSEQVRRRVSELPTPARPGARRGMAPEPEHGQDRTAFWEALFQRPDPWQYASEYEREKYEWQLNLLPPGPIDRALELACAEGHFTESLAPRVRALRATDISATAVSRAAERCGAHANIEFGVFDFMSEAPTGPFNLIVCSEVLYYTEHRASLERIAAELCAALAPGGHLVMAHARVLADDSTRTGFDWEHRWGAETIAQVFSTIPGLALEYSVQTELYRVDRFVHVEPGQAKPTPVVESVPMQARLDHGVARQVVRGGATARRDDVARHERRLAMPVLMYHHVAETGTDALSQFRVAPSMFRQQMRWLRQNGYHAVRSSQVEWFLQRQHPFVGRPVLITFDDGYENFHTHAWPELAEHDLTAEVFIVTGLAGDVARWDSRHGDPARLMDAETIAQLAADGVAFGSHLATHRSADGLSTLELATELIESKAMLERWIGEPVTSLAAPFGQSNDSLRRLAAETGYQMLYTTHPGVLSLESDALALPRFEVTGDLTLDDFARLMRSTQ